MILQNDLPLTNQNRIKGLIELREQVRELIDLQLEDKSEEEIHNAQENLNNIYDKFTKEYGIINSRANENVFSNDSSYFLLCSLEKLDGEGKFIGKADIFTKRTIKARKEITKVDTPDEALILSIQNKAKVDLDYMSKLCGIEVDKIVEDLKGVIFKIPEYGDIDNWVTADEYLSGNVREKLKIAKDVKVFDTIIDDEGQKQRVLNKKETAIASSKQDTIKEAFLNWVWEDPERRNKLEKIYNEKFNSVRPREYDGSHIEFVGMNPEIKLRSHQLNAVAHILYGNNVLLAHEVGAGKTFEMVARCNGK